MENIVQDEARERVTLVTLESEVKSIDEPAAVEL